MKLIALGFRVYVKDKWNLLDVAIVILSVVGIVIEEIVQDLKIIPINPTIIRVSFKMFSYITNKMIY